MQLTLKKLTPFFFLLFCFQISFSQESELTVEKIMQDPEWMGTFPSNVRWGEDSKTIYFNYNLQKDPEDSLYKIALSDKNKIEKVAFTEEKKLIPRSGDYNKKRDTKVYVQDDALMLYSLKDNSSRELIELGNRISNPQFMNDENKISFSLEDNIFVYNLQNGSLDKITNISSREKSDKEPKLNDKDDWVRRKISDYWRSFSNGKTKGKPVKTIGRKPKENLLLSIPEKNLFQTYSFLPMVNLQLSAYSQGPTIKEPMFLIM